ncbi:GNAT family N-acetyltransferase [Streptomyces sp. NPDC088387]|uniref:GNAT family N-acetyltransferase n=1 Tax=Streptomyces sp. NPDC088387 TaxID=3365859 RepID=UPI0038071CC1
MRIVPAQVPDVAVLLGFRVEAAGWLAGRGSDQWQRGYPAEKLVAEIEGGRVFLVKDGDVAAAAVGLSVEVGAGAGLWTAEELLEPSLYVSKLTVARAYAGMNLGGRLLDWAGDRGYAAGARWLRLDAWTSNEGLQAYYLRHGFQHVRTVVDGVAGYGGPRVSGWLAQRRTCGAEHGFRDRTPPPERVGGEE